MSLNAMLPNTPLPNILLPIVTSPVRLNDLPALLGPYAVTAPVYVYLMSSGHVTATRFRLKDEEDLILVLGPRGYTPGRPNAVLNGSSLTAVCQ